MKNHRYVGPVTRFSTTRNMDFPGTSVRRLLRTFIGTTLVAGLAAFAVPHAWTQQTSNDDFSAVSALVTNIELSAPNDAGVLQGSFVAKNYDDRTAGDLGYTLLLIDPEKPIAKNTLVEEDYHLYDRVTVAENFSLAPDEAKTIRFTYTPPRTLPQGNYRLRVRLRTSHDEELGWKSVNVTLGRGGGFFLVTPERVTIQGEPAGEDIATPEGFGPLDGVTVHPGTQTTLHATLSNAGNAIASGTPKITLYHWGLQGKLVRTETAEKVTLQPGARQAFTHTFAAPAEPTAYHVGLELLDDQGTRISSIADYRLVVAGVSGRILSASFTTLTRDAVGVAASIVGPADRTTKIRAKVTAALLDGETVRDETTTDAILLERGGERGLTLNFTPRRALTHPGVRLTLVNADSGETLDTYEFHADVPAGTTSAGPSGEAASRASVQAIVRWVLVVLVALLVIAIIAAAILRTRKPRGPGQGRPSTVIRTLVFILGLAAGALIGTTVSVVRAQGPGAVYYFASTKESDIQRLRIFVNSPIHQNDPTDPNERYLHASVPFEVDIRHSSCGNRVRYIGATVDYVNVHGHSVPTTDDWLPFHDLLEYSKRVWTNPSAFGGEGGPWLTNTVFSYHGNPADASRYTVLFRREVNRSISNGRTTYRATLSLPNSYARITLRIASYVRQRLGVSVGKPEPIHAWVGAYSHLNFQVPPPVVDLIFDTDGDGQHDPEEIPYGGGGTLIWTVQNATSCTASGNWSGPRSATGGQEAVGPLTADRSYTLTCANNGGSAADAVNVPVADPPPTPTPTPGPPNIPPPRFQEQPP